VKVGNQPTDIVAGEGAVWVSTGSGWVTRIDPHTLRSTHVPAPAQTVVSPEGFDCARCKLVRRLRNGFQVWRVAQPGNIATGGGSVWMTLPNNAFQRIDPATGRLVGPLHRIHLPVEHHRCEGWPPGASGCYQLTGPMVFADGSLWMVSWSGGGWFLGGNACCNSAVLRIDPETNAIVEVIPIAGTAYRIAATDMAIWTSGRTQPTSRADFGHPVLWRIDPRTNRVRGSVPCGGPATGNGCLALAAGEGSIWFTNSDDRPGQGIVGRMDPRTNRVIARIHVCRGPSGIAVGGRFVWVACTTSNRVAKINPRTNEVVEFITTGGQPSRIAVTEGSVWVTNAANGTVARIDAPRAGGGP
jgi:streptogramin lyase